ncbi:MAG: DUF3501 family protein [Myxococcota bacterium]|nr:DUF3501 family protein [Myxococcota bacterium]
MTTVTRDEILDFVTYREQRATYRRDILAIKRDRRIHVGPYITFLFENHETIRYQIQEMMLHERIVREADIRHEMDTYNELLGGPGELGCTLLIEIDDVEARQVKLVRWKNLNESLYALLENGEKIKPSWDARQVGDERLSSVQYLKFNTHGQVPVAFGCDFDDPEVAAEVQLTPEQRSALARDL